MTSIVTSIVTPEILIGRKYAFEFLENNTKSYLIWFILTYLTRSITVNSERKIRWDHQSLLINTFENTLVDFLKKIRNRFLYDSFEYKWLFSWVFKLIDSSPATSKLLKRIINWFAYHSRSGKLIDVIILKETITFWSDKNPEKSRKSLSAEI